MSSCCGVVSLFPVCVFAVLLFLFPMNSCCGVVYTCFLRVFVVLFVLAPHKFLWCCGVVYVFPTCFVVVFYLFLINHRGVVYFQASKLILVALFTCFPQDFVVLFFLPS